jgi:hypothetical protein
MKIVKYSVKLYLSYFAVGTTASTIKSGMFNSPV